MLLLSLMKLNQQSNPYSLCRSETTVAGEAPAKTIVKWFMDTAYLLGCEQHW